MSDATPLTRPSLLVRIRDARDAESWQAFVELYTPLVYRYARRRGLQDADAADVAQEVMTEVARSMPRFEYEPERGRFRDWLGCIARRQVGRFFAGQDRTGVGGGQDLDQLAASPADAEWIDEYNAGLLEVVLERAKPHFEPATWQAFTRVWIEGKGSAEVAAELGLPIDTVYVAKCRVLKRLAEDLHALSDDHPLAAAES
jgi:RNA polymerase sigma factor (sigma-70 family)